MEKRYEVSKRVNKRIDELRDQGIVGAKLRNKCYRIKTEEERNAKEESEQKFQKASPAFKAKIRELAIQSGRIVNFKKIQRRSQLYMLIQTKQKLVEIANMINMFELIFENLKKFKVNHILPCELIEGNMAWISQSKDTGKYHYFTMKSGEKPYSLSIFNLIEIVDGISGFQHAFEELARLLDLDDLQDEWITMQKGKYEDNINCLNNQVFIKKRYPTLYRYLYSHIDLLAYFNRYGANHVNRKFMHQDQHLFFVSTTFLAGEINPEKPDQPAVSRAINLLALLGLIKKIPHTDLPKDLLEIASEIRGNNTAFRLITFFQIPFYDTAILQNAEAVAKVLERARVRTSRQVNKKNVSQYFGAEMVKNIYVPNYKMEKKSVALYQSDKDIDSLFA